MRPQFDFPHDDYFAAFGAKIVNEMMDRFGIGVSEAAGRINEHWIGQNLVGEDLVLYHETPEYWAQQIYYQLGSHWWLEGEKLKPRQYPGFKNE